MTTVRQYEYIIVLCTDAVEGAKLLLNLAKAKNPAKVPAAEKELERRINALATARKNLKEHNKRAAKRKRGK